MIKVVGFDADDTLWRSQDYFDDAQARFEQILAQYIDLQQTSVQQHLLDVERRNVRVFGYGVKGMMLSMIESAIELSQQRISGRDIHAIVELGKEVLQHPVELLSDVVEAVDRVARDFEVVLITKGDLFHQEAKVRASGLADRFGRIEIVSEKDQPTYRRVLDELQVQPAEFLMVGNSLKSDIEPVLQLGGWGVHVPYHSTWILETIDALPEGLTSRYRKAQGATQIPQMIEELLLASRA